MSSANEHIWLVPGRESRYGPTEDPRGTFDALLRAPLAVPVVPPVVAPDPSVAPVITPREVPAVPVRVDAELASLSEPLRRLLVAVDAVAAQAAVELPGPQAIVEARALLAVTERLRHVGLDRIGDIDRRRLAALEDAPSTHTWVRRQHTSLTEQEVTLARRLGRAPQIAAALTGGRLTISQATRVGAAMATVRRHLDRPDGLIQGRNGEQVVTNVVTHGVRQVVCEAFGGLADTDPRLTAMISQTQANAARQVSQKARIELAFLTVAHLVDGPLLTASLGRLIDAILPEALEDRADAAHDERAFTMVRKHGGGWRITQGELDDPTGELLHTVLAAALAVDSDNPTDTAAYAQLREQGWDSSDPLPAEEDPTGRGSNRTDGSSPENASAGSGSGFGGSSGSGDSGSGSGSGGSSAGTDDAASQSSPGPRSMRQRRHDALSRTLRRLLDSGELGLRDKAAPHINVTLGVELLESQPGALPATTGSGHTVAASLALAWTCTAAHTRWILSLGRTVLAASHTARTLTATERRAKHLQSGGRCEVAGCHRGPGHRLIPHHATPWASSRTTSLTDTVLFCEHDHHHVHTGHTVQLRDGRRLGPHGWTDPPPDPGS